MAKYVPPFKKEKVFSSENESRWSGLRDEPGRPGRFDKQEKPERSKNDRYEKPHDRYIAANAAATNAANAANAVDLEDFPALKSKVPKTPGAEAPKGRMTYASLAANWAEQVKANEEKARKEAEEAAEHQRIIAKLNEVKIVRVGKGVIAKKRVDSDDDKEVDIGCHTSDHSEYSDGPDNYDVTVDAESESEEEEEDPDAFWTQRKNRNEIY